MRSRSILTALFAAIVAVALTACSSGSGGGSDLASVKQAGVLRVGTEGTYSPFSFHDPKTNALTGYDVEVAKAVADKLGVKVEYVETPWDAIFAGLGADRYDAVVNQVTRTPNGPASTASARPTRGPRVSSPRVRTTRRSPRSTASTARSRRRA